MREHGSVNVDHLPDDFPVPDVALRLRCSACGSRNMKTQPNWRKGEWARNYGDEALEESGIKSFRAKIERRDRSVYSSIITE